MLFVELSDNDSYQSSTDSFMRRGKNLIDCASPISLYEMYLSKDFHPLSASVEPFPVKASGISSVSAFGMSAILEIPSC